jgi:hypothetical protein
MEMVAARAAASALKDFRIGIPGGDGICPISSDVKEVLGAALAAIRKTGAKIDSGWPQGVDPAAVTRNLSNPARREHVFAASQGAARTDAQGMGAQPARSDAQRRIRAAPELGGCTPPISA